VGSLWIREQEIVVFRTEQLQVLEVVEEWAYNLVLALVDIVVEQMVLLLELALAT
jgi:hypothetical protein